MQVMVFGGITILFLVVVWKRLMLTGQNVKCGQELWAFGQTTGNKEVQADVVQVCRSQAGIMAVLADGIGKENTGKVAAQVAADAVLDAFEPYQAIHNPEYLFQTAFLEAHGRVQQTIGERRGGASLGAIFVNGSRMHYALAGNIKIALVRNGELIPLSKGHTLDVLARDAYQEGRLSKNETIWSQDENRIWNYLGKDGFHEIETGVPPITLKTKDLVVMVTQGIYEELSWAEIEMILLSGQTIQEMADQIIKETERKDSQEKENGSVLLLVSEVAGEKNQF